MKFDEETKRMYLATTIHSPLRKWFRRTQVSRSIPQSSAYGRSDPEIIRVIREEIDPGQAFIKVPKETK